MYECNIGQLANLGRAHHPQVCARCECYTITCNLPKP
jgi:hypothetical protein